MRRLLSMLVLCVLFAAAGAAGAFWLLRAGRPKVPDPPALVERMREVARLETLDVTLYKKVSFEPDLEEASTLPGAVWNWAKFTLRPTKGKAIVFAEVHLGMDVSRLDARSLRVQGDAVEVVLPPIQAAAELKPGETEVVGSNLDSQQTAQLLQVAKEHFEREAMADPRLQERARQSARRTLQGLLLSLGFREVRFVESLPTIERG